MRERVTALLPRDKGKGLSVSTFHTLGLNILRREHKHLGFKPASRFSTARTAAI